MLKLRSLTRAERLLIDRRRQFHSQREEAKARRVSLYQYRRWEDGKDEVPHQELSPISQLTIAESCWLHRRRAKMALGALARKLRVSKWWLTKMEAGKEPVSDALRAFWARKKPRRAG